MYSKTGLYINGCNLLFLALEDSKLLQNLMSSSI